ncbi:response regulator [Nitrobacter sp.]|uniref:response regulator n=1 Tax=Nitrobacter sp. TaxID=29420 RepID=UPI003F64D89E
MKPIVPGVAAATSAGMPGDILIVEDDAIIALDFEQTVAEFGVTRVRVASSVAQALVMIAERAPDFALLDIGLSEEKSFAVAKRLAVLNIPFVFVTGYSGDKVFPPEYSGRPRLPKPFLRDELFSVLSNWQTAAQDGPH